MADFALFFICMVLGGAFLGAMWNTDNKTVKSIMEFLLIIIGVGLITLSGMLLQHITHLIP